MSGVNDNVQRGVRGQAIVNIIQWLEDGSFLNADDLMSALDLLDLDETDVECICRNFTHGRCVPVPLLGRIS